ncbi:hypothetical protein AAW51_2000 [Caldimonas brevitalea]|uniref:Uncharacterized protein n=1 Tax=Caldimonas brevitalea TaxID=413882 RepID=A0A0G3BMS9_9BURK|nr:hypothetical protein AAW51_2000 [Caldimonas brevitalea]
MTDVHLRVQLRGDLDAVMVLALRKAPEGRCTPPIGWRKR